MKIPKEKILPLIMSALNEDIGPGSDVTTGTVFENNRMISGEIIAKQDCVLAGIDVAKWIFEFVDEEINFKALAEDGAKIKKGRRVVYVRGPAINILTAERTALNFISRLSGVATITSKYVEKVKKYKSRIFDTRKTLPGFRILDKYAVRIGGGSNHRMGLWDQILIKDNHLSATGDMKQGARVRNIKAFIAKARSKGYKKIEVEVTNLKEFQAALEAGADIIMLDNMKIEDIRKAVKIRSRLKAQGSRSKIEVSGGVNLDSVKRMAATGVERISIGEITHSAPSIDFSLEAH